ncbi:zinc finger protein 236-like [Anopheles aquasalis]|uniref:zinc finger protein 236-like n=1 Tax=Anopheles aquasalis TaxID=42839 RepID=UPI00215A8D87|nr:zinc finger protein 236-like [Anopheles aquasalis]
MLCSKRGCSMGLIVCAANDVKLRDHIFRITQYKIPELPAILSPVCGGCRSQIEQCDQVPPITFNATDGKYPTVLLNVDPNDPLAVPESAQQLCRSNHVPAEEWRTNFTSNPMKIFRHMCELCGTVVRSAKKHVAQHKDGGMFRCFFCEQSFVNKPLLECHISGHNKKLFVCHLCGQAYRTKSMLKWHMIRCCHTNHAKHRSKVYSCKCCGKTFFSNYKRLKHQEQHDKKRVYECFVCRAVFPSLEYLQRHRRKHAVDRGKVKPEETFSDETVRIDSKAVNSGKLKHTDVQEDTTTEREQQNIPAPEPLLPSTNTVEVTEATSDNNLSKEEDEPKEQPPHVLESEPLLPTTDRVVVTETTSDSNLSKEVNEPREQPLHVLESDSIAPTNDAAPTNDSSVSMELIEKPLDKPLGSDVITSTNDPFESKENECLSESSTIDRTEHNIPTFTEIPKTLHPEKRITILQVLDLPRLPQQHGNGPTPTGCTEPPTKSQEAVTASLPAPDDPPTLSVCEELIHQPNLIKLEILPAWKSHEKINPELWPILGIPTSIPFAMKRKDISSSLAKHKEQQQTRPRFEDRLLQLPPCLKKDCNCDDFVRCLYA